MVTRHQVHPMNASRVTMKAPPASGAVRGIRRLAQLIVMVMLVHTLWPPVAMGGDVVVGEGNNNSLVQACYDPVQNWKMGPLPGEWCYDVFRNLKVDATQGGVALSWQPGTRSVPWNCGPDRSPGACAISGVRVEAYYVEPGRGVVPGGRCSAGLDGGTCAIGGLVPGTRYKVEIFAELANGAWLRTNSSIVPCCVPPAAPQNVVVSAAGSALDVSWSQSPDWGGASELTYRVSTIPPTSTCEVVALACRLEGVPRSTPIVVSVIASNTAGSSPPSMAEAVTLPQMKPSPPPDVTARYVKGGSARVSWLPPIDDGGSSISRYVVTAAPGGKSCTSTSARVCTISGLTPGKAYSFTVNAINRVGASGSSPAGVAGRLVTQASAPREVTAGVMNSSVQVSWSRPVSLGGGKLLEYVVRVGDSVCTTKGTTCTVSGLGLGRTYPVAVTAVTTGGTSRPASGTVTVPAPQPVKASAVFW